MRIGICKDTPYKCTYTLVRDNNPLERISLDTRTFLLHDICHYVVEKQLAYENGFWGMLAKGHAFSELFGKENELTAELRFIEKIVGPVQSVYLGNIPRQDFNVFVQHLDLTLTDATLNNCLEEIGAIMNRWQSLDTGNQLTLDWKL